MGILSGLFRSRDKPKDSTAGSAYRFFFGTAQSGKLVTERSAMQMTAVYACVRVLSEAVAGLPVHLYRYSGDGSKEKAMDHPLYFLLHDEPNPEMSSFVFRETLMTHLLLWGNGYAQIIRNGKGEVVALYPLMPNRMTVDRDSHGNLYYEYQLSTDEPRIDEPGTVVLHPSEVLHAPSVEMTTLYLRICCGGLIFITAYNVISGIFRGIGNSKLPLLFVGIACVVNIALDLITVCILHWDVAGVAISTITAQAVSVILSLVVIRKMPLPFDVSAKLIRFHDGFSSKILKAGIPLAFQDLLTNLSFVVINSVANQLGPDATAWAGLLWENSYAEKKS